MTHNCKFCGAEECGCPSLTGATCTGCSECNREDDDGDED